MSGLLLVGTSLGSDTQIVRPTGAQTFDEFVSTTLHVLAGTEVYHCRVSRDFSPIPEHGVPVELVVTVDAYPTRAGAGYRLTALRYATPDVEPLRLAASE